MKNRPLPILTVGTVVDTNDPQQMGRLRISCPKWGDTDSTLVIDLPWASYVSPFAGVLTRGGRGPENQISSGPIAYGMWAIPKVGATVVCMLLDEDANHRAWLGCIPADHMVHTMPMGRYLDAGETGPVTSTEHTIEPLATNLDTAFGTASESYERLTRGVENQVGSISGTIVEKTVSTRADDRSDTSRTGYQKSRIRCDLSFPETGAILDPQMYCITTPGLHTLLMDDSLGNGKIRMRTTSGNQVILDDTNERIYVSTATGNNYIEMDKYGNVEVYSDRRVSMHAKKGFNFTSEGEFRVSAKSIHMRTSEDLRVHTGTNIEMRSEGPMNLDVGSTLKLTADGDTDISITGHLNTSVSGEYNLNSGDILRIESALAMNLQSSADDVNIDSNKSYPYGIHLNDGLASPAVDSVAVFTDAKYAYTTNRVPIHEPWGRISNKTSLTDQDSSENKITDVLNMTNTSSTLELPYASSNANKTDLGDTLTRNDYWRR